VWEQDDATRQNLMQYCGFEGDWDSSYDAILRMMFGSHAGLLILPIQDLLQYGSDTRLNTPGNSNGNWSYRLTRDQLKKISTQKFLHWNRLYGRI
jgi:4-alpha-glucanotransferase